MIQDAVTTTPPVLISAADAASYAGVRPATMQVLLAPVRADATMEARLSLYDLDELAVIMV